MQKINKFIERQEKIRRKSEIKLKKKAEKKQYLRKIKKFIN